MKKAIFLVVLAVLTTSYFAECSDELFIGEDVPAFCQNLSAETMADYFWWFPGKSVTLTDVRAVLGGFLVTGFIPSDDVKKKMSILAKFTLGSKYPEWVHVFSSSVCDDELKVSSLGGIIDGDKEIILRKTVALLKTDEGYQKYEECFWIAKLEGRAGSSAISSRLIADYEVVLVEVYDDLPQGGYAIVFCHRHSTVPKWFRTEVRVNEKLQKVSECQYEIEFKAP